MLAPHLNPAIDAHMRFRLALQVSNVKRLVESPKNVWMTAYSLTEVRRYRRAYPYGWQVAGTTLDNLFRLFKVPWDDEDEEKVAAGHVRTSTYEDRSFWVSWLRPPVERLRPVTRPADELPVEISCHLSRSPSRRSRRLTWSRNLLFGGRTLECTATSSSN